MTLAEAEGVSLDQPAVGPKVPAGHPEGAGREVHADHPTAGRGEQGHRPPGAAAQVEHAERPSRMTLGLQQRQRKVDRQPVRGLGDDRGVLPEALPLAALPDRGPSTHRAIRASVLKVGP